MDTSKIKSFANLQGADLRSANLQGADLRSANLRSAKFINFYSIYFGKLSDGLTIQGMLHDAATHPAPNKFIEWIKTDTCPYNDCITDRKFRFKENKELFKAFFKNRKSNKIPEPSMTDWEWISVACKENNIKI